MGQRGRICGLMIATLWTAATVASDGGTNEPVAAKGAKVELAVQVSAGEPPRPIGNAEVSIKGADGSDLRSPRRTDKKGEVRFRDLAKGEVTLVIVAKDWKTYRATLALGKPQEVLTASLQPLD